jgi:hypothetical protein
MMKQVMVVGVALLWDSILAHLSYIRLVHLGGVCRRQPR